MRRREPDVRADGEASVAVGRDAYGPILVNSPLQINVSHHPVNAPSPRPKSLPPDVPDFIGREREVAEIDGTVRGNLRQGGSTTAVISGKPGVGKTSLAVRIAHRVESRFPDGVLHADLRGVERNPPSPAEIAGRLLHALGVPDDEIPADAHLRLDVYRRRTAGLTLLVVLDNAADERQVRPLLLTGPGSCVLVTSRNKLAGLESAHRFDLETFPVSTSVEFLQAVTGRTFKGDEAATALTVAEHCGHLPLALRIAAHRMQSNRTLRISDLAAELRHEQNRLGALAVGDLAVRKAFNLSYRKLGKSGRNAFRKLSHVPASDFGPGICGALTGAGEVPSGKTLRKLSEANLIEPSAVSGRYRFHDLLKEFAREKLRKDPPAELAADSERMMVWLQHSALRAQFRIAGIFEVELLEDKGADIPSMEAAIIWVEQELDNAVAALSRNEAADRSGHITTLALALCAVCEVVGRWEDWATVSEAGLAASTGDGSDGLRAVFLGSKANIARYRREFAAALTYASQAYDAAHASEEPLLIADAANLLGCVLRDTGKQEEGLPLLLQSLEIFERHEVKHEIGKVLYNLGTVHRASGELEKAIEYFERDLTVCVQTSDEPGAAETLNTLALTYTELGRPDQAEKLQRESLAKFSKIGNPHKVSMVLNDLALTLRRQDRLEEALSLHGEDVELCRTVGNVSGEAVAHGNAADVLLLLGRVREASDRAELAQSRLTELGDEQRLAEAVVSHIAILFKDGRIDEVAAKAEWAVDVLTRFGDGRRVAGAHQILAREYGEHGRWEDSLAHAERSLRGEGKDLSPSARAVSRILAVHACLRLGRTDQAARHRAFLPTCSANPPTPPSQADAFGL